MLLQSIHEKSSIPHGNEKGRATRPFGPRPVSDGTTARHLSRMDVDVPWFRYGGADLDAVQPLVLEHLVDEDPTSRQRLEHLPQQGSTGARGEVVDRRGAVYVVHGLGLSGGDIRGIERVGQLGDSPGELLEVQAVVDDAARPNVDEARVIVLGRKLFWSYVRLAPAQARRHVYGLFPRQTVDSRGAVITDLELAFSIEEDVFGLDVTMSDALTVQVPETRQDLFE